MCIDLKSDLVGHILSNVNEIRSIIARTNNNLFVSRISTTDGMELLRVMVMVIIKRVLLQEIRNTGSLFVSKRRLKNDILSKKKKKNFYARFFLSASPLGGGTS